MAKISTRHKGRESAFRFDSFYNGVKTTENAFDPSPNSLTACQNMSYGIRESNGKQYVFLKKRRGTTKLTTSVAPARIIASTYYNSESQYIIATASKLYYLNSGVPTEIGDLTGVTSVSKPRFTEYNGKLIIHQIGGTKVWDGSTYDDLDATIENEDIGSGDGTTVNFTGYLAQPEIETSSITITYISGGTTYTITDNGSGALTGDVDGGGTNTINYTNGAFDFDCSNAPSVSTDITADYTYEAGAPITDHGLVRQGRLYGWCTHSSTNDSRLYYTSADDETGWDTSTGGGYIDIDPDNGFPIIGVINFFSDTMLVFKENGTYRINSYPGESSFSVEPLLDNVGSSAEDSVIFDGDVVSFISDYGWHGIRSSQRFGDVQTSARLDKFWYSYLRLENNSNANVIYNRFDDQLWLDFKSTATGRSVYVLNVGTGGQLSTYKFDFDHSSIDSANNAILIGGHDGNLYKMGASSYSYQDNSEDYSSYFITNFSNNSTYGIGKYNKSVRILAISGDAFTCTFTVHKNNSTSSSVISESVSETSSGIHDIRYNRKFNWDNVRVTVSNILGEYGVEFYEIVFTAAMVGSKDMLFETRDYDALTFGGYSVLFGGEPAVL